MPAPSSSRSRRRSRRASRLLDNLPILPQHKLEAALDAGTFQKAWTPATPLSEIAGLGPFVLAEHVSGQRLVFTRNPHYWRQGRRGARCRISTS